MKRILRAALAAGLGLFALPLAQGQTLEDFARLPQVWDAEISPDGRWLALGCQREERKALCTFDLANPSDPAVFSPPETHRLNYFYFAGPDYLIINFDTLERLGRDELRVDRAVSLEMGTWNATMLMRNQRSTTDNTNVISLNTDDPDTVYVEITLLTGGRVSGSRGYQRREEFRSGLFEVDLATGEGERVETGREVSRLMTPQGETVARVYHDTATHVLEIRRGTSSGEVLYSALHESDRPYVPGFIDPGGMLVVFPAGENRGLRRLDLVDGTLRPLPIGEPDVLYGTIIDRETGTLLGITRSRDALPEQVFLDEGLKRDSRALAGALGVERVLIRSFSSDRNRIVVQTVETGRPSSFFLYDRAAGSVGSVGSVNPVLDQMALPVPQMIEYEASDGMEIPAVLTLPLQRDPDNPPPLVVLPHGGPQAHDDLEFDWWAQAYAALGYAVLQPNYRGSSGYGEDFIEAGYGEFGGRMIEDILDGARHLQAEGLVRQGDYCLVGASYGGYAALMGSILAPEEVACVVSVNGVTNPFAMLGRHSGFAAEAYWDNYFGSRFDSEAYQESISPLDRPDDIRAPVLLMHAREDTTVPPEQSIRLARALDGRAHYIEMEGDNHYLTTATSRRQLLETTARFLSTHLPVE